jgi:tetratricopeptide (TPR) repeat protein
MQVSRRALATYEALSRARQGDLMTRSGLSEAVSRVGYYQARTGDMGVSLESTKHAVRLSEEVVLAAPSDERYRSRLARQLAELGDRLLATGRRPESLAPYTRALEIRQQLADERPDDPARARARATSLHKMGYAHGAQGAFGEAMAFYRRALELRERLVSAEAALVADRAGLAETLIDIGTLEVHAGHLPEAEILYRRALSLREQILDENPTVTQSQNDLAILLVSLAELQRQMGASEGLATLRRAADLAGRTTRSAPEDTIYRYNLAMVQEKIGLWERQIGTPGRALTAHRHAVTLFDGLVIAEPGNASHSLALARNLVYCASLERPTSPTKATASLDRARLVMDGIPEVDTQLRYDLAAEFARLAGPTTASPAEGGDSSRRLCRSQALAVLRRLIEAGYRDRQRIALDPAFDGLRAHPGFQHLMLDLDFPSDPFAR